MARTNPTLIFREINLHDPASLQLLMTGVDYYLTNTVLNPNAPETTAMQMQEKAVADLALSRTRGLPRHSLPLEATLKFIDYRGADDWGVLRAARDLETLAYGEALLFPESYPDKYEVAWAVFESNRPEDELPADEQALRERVSFLAEMM